MNQRLDLNRTCFSWFCGVVLFCFGRFLKSAGEIVETSQKPLPKSKLLPLLPHIAALISLWKFMSKDFSLHFLSHLINPIRKEHRNFIEESKQ